MDPIFIAIIFLLDGEPILESGFMPLAQPSMEVCEDRLAALDEYVEILEPELPGNVQVLTTLCGTEEEILHILETGEVPE